MANTGRNKKLASFNCDEKLWAEFMRRCQDKGTTATATLTQFISLYLDGSLDNLDALDNNLDKHLDERIKACVNDYLEKRLPSYLDKYLASYQGNNTRASASSSISTKNFWFIQERARHLGLSINADQRLKIEMFANDAYQRRHGELPKRQPFRGTQAFAYPKSDVDILDDTIRGVVARG